MGHNHLPEPNDTNAMTKAYNGNIKSLKIDGQLATFNTETLLYVDLAPSGVITKRFLVG